MAIAITLQEYLDGNGVNYDVLKHRHSASSFETSSSARVPMKQLAKAVVYRDEDHHYLMAVIPSQNHAQTPPLNKLTNHRLQLATEAELGKLFSDCELGAVPPVGQAYNVRVVWDDRLLNEEDIYLEAGDHEHLIHLKKDQFADLMAHMPHGDISRMASVMGYDHTDIY